MNLKSTTAQTQAFLDDLLAGLSSDSKTLPCKYFYDKRGSELFDQICQLEEYYVTRTEQWIMDQHASEMADQLGRRVRLVELGSGSSTKTHVLLRHLNEPAAYVPVDISRKHLLNTAGNLRQHFPNIEILPVVADFTKPFQIPDSKIRASHNAIYFPGSTIGNFPAVAAADLLENLSQRVGPEGGLLIGADLQKDPAVLEAAYNDRQGVTAEFNLNLLRRANEQLDANFDLEQFRHRASYNKEHGRIEMYLISETDQTVLIDDHPIEFSAGEKILTEFSHKYTIDGFQSMAAQAGFQLHKMWTDPQQYFAVFHFVLET